MSRTYYDDTRSITTKQTVLRNGLTVILNQVPDATKLDIKLCIKAGDSSENDYPEGIAHFVEHMTFGGTNKFTNAEIINMYNKLHAFEDAFTAENVTMYGLKIDPYDISTAMQLLSDMIIESTYLEDIIKKEKTIVKCEDVWHWENDMDSVLSWYMSKGSYGNAHIYDPAAAIYADIDSITRDDVLRFVNEFYIPNNTIISFSGSFNEDQVMREIQTTLGSWQGDDTTPTPPIEISEYCGGFIQAPRESNNITYLGLGFKGATEYGLDNLIEEIAVTIIRSCLDVWDIRQDIGCIYVLDTMSAPVYDSGTWWIKTFTCPENTNLVIDTIIDSLHSIVQNNVTDGFVEQCKQYTMDNIFNSGNVDEVTWYSATTGELPDIDDIYAQIQQINTRMVKDWLHDKICNNDCTFVVLGAMPENMYSYEEINQKVQTMASSSFWPFS